MPDLRWGQAMGIAVRGPRRPLTAARRHHPRQTCGVELWIQSVLMADNTEAESRAEDVSVREAFRQLGYPESRLARAIQGFGTVERAKQWIEILGPPALASDYIYEIAMSKIAPADYLHWRDTGLSPLEAIRTPRHLAKAGLDIDDYGGGGQPASVKDSGASCPI